TPPNRNGRNYLHSYLDKPPGCAGSGKDPRAGAVTIYVLADQVPAAGQQAPQQSVPGNTGSPESEPAETETTSESESGGDSEPQAPAAESDPAAPAACHPSPAVMLDGAIIPAHLLAELAAGGAKVQPLTEIAALPTERQYRPSAALTAFVRMRAMTCSFPGCSRAAHRCDLDHLILWPAGATHPANLAPLCRLHHLLTTFSGWQPTAKPDGSMHWHAPTGNTYTKAPGAAILFPHWNIHTPVPRRRAIRLLGDADRHTRMPVRTRTRAQDRTQRITSERARNATARALEHTHSDSDPPPF
ncbi:HNH endonuclease, partial [Mycobacterium adipatum]